MDSIHRVKLFSDSKEEKERIVAEDEGEIALIGNEEPVSPVSQLLHAPGFNLCIIVLIGLKTSVNNVDTIKVGLQETIVKHPRFSSILVLNKKKQSWRRTRVNIDDHIIMPDLNTNMETPDLFVEDYTSSLSTSPLNTAIPLWELHILNVKTKDANSTAILRVHHSIGDGISLISLLLSCTRKSSDPGSLPTIPWKKHKENENKLARMFSIWWVVSWAWRMNLILFNTLVDCILFVAKILFLKDTETPIKGPIYEIVQPPKRFVHRIVSLDDVKLVKNSLKITINDVILGVTQGGLSLYLNRRYKKHSVKGFGNIEKSNHLPKDIRLNAAVMFNSRQSSVVIEDLDGQIEKVSKGSWGNLFSYVIVPLTIGLQEDPLTYIKQAKSVIDRKKLSLESKLTFLASELTLKLFGTKAASTLVNTVLSNTTLSFSNVVGPQEEVMFYGHPINYLAPTVSGIPQALLIHFQSYESKLIISLAVDENVIPDPHQLCDDLAKTLDNIKDGIIDRSKGRQALEMLDTTEST